MDLKIGFCILFSVKLISDFVVISQETPNISELIEIGSDIYRFMTAEPPSNYSYYDSVKLVTVKLQVCNKFVIPKLSLSKPLLVGVEFSLIAFRDFDEVHEKFSVLGSMNIVWKDELMAWNESQYNGLRTIIVPDTISWRPTLVLVNAFEEFKMLGEDSRWPIRYSSSGLAFFFPGGVFTSTCSADVTFYPWDRQSCKLVFSIYGYSVHEVKLLSLSPKVNVAYFVGHGEWDVIDSDVKTIHGDLVIMFEFVIKRKPLFAVLNIIVPIIILSILNNFVFLIPADSGERISYCITVFLAQVVFLTLVGENMPKSAQPIALLSYYIISLLSLSMFAMGCTVVNMKMYYRSETMQVSDIWIYLVSICQNRKSLCLNCTTRPSKKHLSQENEREFYVERHENNLKDLPEEDQRDPGMVERNGGKYTIKDNLFTCWNKRIFEDSEFKEEITWHDVSNVLDAMLFVLTFVLLAVFTFVYFIIVTVQ